MAIDFRLRIKACGLVIAVLSISACLTLGGTAHAGSVLTLDSAAVPLLQVDFHGPGLDYYAIWGTGGSFGNPVLDGKSLAFAYCVDFYDDINPPGSYATTVSSDGTIFGTPVTNAGGIAWLVDHFALSATTGDLQDGLQCAIWKLEYGSEFTLDGAGSDTTAVVSAYNGYLSAYTNAGSPSDPVSNLLWLSPLDVQNVHQQGLISALSISAQSSIPAPEPSTLVLAGLAMVGTVIRMRWRAHTRRA